ncbi:MAG: 3-deoxy-7-phosphoheptulonate synthase [Deltaproteobacteria bacterium]|nr:3-deoxy-7-phosphoheptulonate synthase [Deltaproteobacteria bacterium]
MVIVMRPGATEDQLQAVIQRVEEHGLTPHVSRGKTQTIVGCIGDEHRLEEPVLLSLPGVARVLSVERPYKLASRDFATGSTIVPLGDKATVGNGHFAVIAGPCSVEGHAMLRETATEVAKAGAVALRGGAFKPRTSPYSFQGLGEEGLQILARVRDEVGLPIVTEVLDTRHVALVAQYADVLQIGARNMQNYALLSEVGSTDKPVLLKRGMSALLEDFLLAAEYIMTEGNANVILCERGIRTFERAMRNTLDMGAVPFLKRETHLPVIVDPSHAAGRRDLVEPLALAAVAAGADGLIVEVHPDPDRAKTDGDQSLSFEMFAHMMHVGRAVRKAVQ